MKNLAIYIHIPFCKQKCKYCDFNSYADKDSFADAYIKALVGEILSYSESAKDYTVMSVYFGGGTPSFIEAEKIREVMMSLRDNYCFSNSPEVTIEANPGTISKEKLEIYLESGINRLSFGVQAVQDRILREIGRIHTFSDVEKGYFEARKVGFENISFDLMFGLPKQTLKDVEESVKTFIDLGPEHISAYSLKVEDSTVFGRLKREGKLDLPSEEEEREMYYLIKEKLKSANYLQYEISNFSKAGRESRHNLAYWKRIDYLGFGAGAASCFENCRFSNEESLEGYIQKADKRVYKEKLTAEVIHSEEIILGLRLIEGVPKTLFSTVGEREKVRKLINYGLLQENNERILLSERGLDLANQVFVEFI